MEMRASGRDKRYPWSKNIHWNDEDRREVAANKVNNRYLVIIDSDELSPWINGPNRLKGTCWGVQQQDIVDLVGDAASKEWAKMCRHSPEKGYLTMSPGLWVRPFMLAIKSIPLDRMAKALTRVKQWGNRNPHFDAQAGDLFYAFLVYSLSGTSTQDKERFQFAVWSNIDPTLEAFQGGMRDWSCGSTPCPENHERKVLMEPAFVRCMQGHSLVGASDERAGVMLSYEQGTNIEFVWHDTDANKVMSIMRTALRGTYEKSFKEMRPSERSNVKKKASDAWRMSDVVERTHLMQSPFPVSDPRCSSGMRHEGGSRKVVNAQIKTKLRMAHCQGVNFIMTYTGAIVCRKDVNHTCIEEIWMKAERRNNRSWAYERVGPYVPIVCTPTIDPCVRWAIRSTVAQDDVRAGKRERGSTLTQVRCHKDQSLRR